MTRGRHALLVVSFFVCPLVFFTNLTRNPYVTQISLLNMALLLSGAALALRLSKGSPSSLGRTPLDAPLASWLGVCALSWGVAFAFHRPFFRASMSAEGARAFLYLAANALIPFAVAADVAASSEPDSEVALGPWVAFAVLWGVAWTAFPAMRGSAPGAPADVWSHLFDGYGALLWAAGLVFALRLTRRGRAEDYLHLALATGFLASTYGVLQYFNMEFVWPQTLNPYGGRSVSTFGNPNFMSSFNVVLLPITVSFFSRASGGRRAAYGALALILEAALLCSLTRSSWLGTVAALAVLACVPDFRRAVAREPKAHGLLAGTALGMALLWPSSSIVSGYTPSVVGRVAEVVAAARANQAYGSFYQRVLIWTCGWLMGAENPVTGKGYGLFELFYPFYQGHVVNVYDFYRGMRTHANNGHNEIVEVWAQTGLLGLGVFFWTWVAFFTAAARRWAGKLSERAALSAACAAGVAGMLVDNMLNVSMHFAVPGFLFWWAAGTAMAERRSAAPRPKAAAGVPAAAAPKAWSWGLRALALALTLLCWVWVRVWFREVHYFAGFKLLRQRSFAAATKELELSRAWGPREVNAIYELGNAYAQTERPVDAAAAYRQALEANAGYDEIYYNVGAILVKLGKTEQAIDHFRVANWINPTSAEVYSTLGNLYLADPRRYGDDGIALLAQAVRKYPDDAKNWNNLGYLYTQRGRLAEAVGAYERALQADPGLATAERNLEGVAAQAKLPRPKILDSLGRLRELEARVTRRDYSDATLALAQRLDRELPDFPKVRFFLGSLLMARGRPADALAPLEWVASRQPNMVWGHMNLGEAYLALGRRGDAARQYRAALELEPSNAQAQTRLGQLGAQ